MQKKNNSEFISLQNQISVDFPVPNQ